MTESAKEVTDVDFEKMVDGLNLSDITKAVMRKSVGLSYNSSLIPSTRRGVPEEMLLGWSKVPRELYPKKDPLDH